MESAERPTPITGNMVLLRQGLGLLDALDDESYRHARPGRSSVGDQYRHVLEHYELLLGGGGEVDYDDRARDEWIASDRSVAARRTRAMLARLEALDPRTLDTAVTIRMAALATGDPRRPTPSSLGRELLFLVSHTVHHFAIIRLLLEAHGHRAPDDLGTAPSTLAHQLATG